LYLILYLIFICFLCFVSIYRCNRPAFRTHIAKAAVYPRYLTHFHTGIALCRVIIARVVIFYHVCGKSRVRYYIYSSIVFTSTVRIASINLYVYLKHQFLYQKLFPCTAVFIYNLSIK
jgi:hypothetical protein